MLGVFTSALTLVIGFILGLIALFSTAFASLSAGILHWVTSGNFISLSYTNAGVLPGDPRFNEFVSMGWELTRGLTNIIFVVAMIAIGLGTALGRNEYQAKKALPILIIIALLINFTPVLLGIVIDASNIVMNYFLNAVGGFDFFMNNMGVASNLISTTLGKFFDPSAQLNLVVGLLVMIVFSILAGIVFFLFSLLFIGRFIALWLLVILSPFALACYILPATRKYYTQWLTQLIQWLMIGITGGFFLYLASKMIEISSKVKIAEDSGVLGAIFGANIANQILPWGISIALMFIGLSAGLTTGAMGANLAINWGKKAGKAIGGFTAAQTISRAMATKKGGEIMEGWEKTKLGLPETLTDWKKASWGKRIAGALLAPAAYPARWGLRAGAKQALTYGAKQSGVIDAKTAELEKQYGKDFSKAASTYSNISPLDWQSKIAMASYLAKTKGGKALGVLDKDPNNPTQLRDAIKQTATYMPHKLEDIIKHMPDIVKDSEVGESVQNAMVSTKKNSKGEYEDSDMRKEAKDYPTDEKTMMKNATYNKLADAMKTSDIETMSGTVMDNDDFKEAIVKWKNSRGFITKMLDEWGAGTAEKLQKQAEKIDKTLEKIAKTNPTFMGMPHSPAGQQVMRNWEVDGRSLNKNDVNGLIASQRILAEKPELKEVYKLTKEIKSLEKELARARKEGVGREEEGRDTIGRIQIEIKDKKERAEDFINTQVEPNPERKAKWQQLENTLKTKK